MSNKRLWEIPISSSDLTDASVSLSDYRRLIGIALFIFFLFSILMIQFYKIQVIEGEKWRKAADRQHRLMMIEPYSRGIFLSNTDIREEHPNKPQSFVIDVPRFHLYADPAAIKEKFRLEIIQKLSEILHLSSEGKQKIEKELNKKSRSRKIALWLSREIYEKVTQWWYPYARLNKIPRNALFFIHDYKRCYPFGKLLGQILHTVRAERDQLSYECVPTGGLELSCNSYLSGKDGKRLMLRSPRQSLDTGQVIEEPQHGADIYLTINHHLQAIAEEKIAKAVKNAQAKGGWAVMMDPYTGSILAWAQYPFFDPTHYQDYFNNPLKEEETKVKAITDPFEPGSTMKPLTLAICLKANLELQKQGKPPLFSPHEKISTADGKFPGRSKPMKDLRTYHYLNMYMALQKSSNIYMGRMIQRVIEALGEKWYRSVLEEVFGFGLKTGIELQAESAGMLPKPGKKHPNGKLEWSKPTPFSLAIGYNLLTNSLQMVRNYAILANGGYDVHPTLIRKVIRKNGEVVLDNENQSPRKRLLEPTIIEEISRAMRFTTKTGGTATRAHISGYTVAGKTSTTEKIVGGSYSKKNHVSTFIGYAPATHPAFVLFIGIDEPAYNVGKNQLGGICAAPAFQEIGEEALRYLGIPPDDPNHKSWSEEVTALKKLYEKWN